jgi:hypothetical protein
VLGQTVDVVGGCAEEDDAWLDVADEGDVDNRSARSQPPPAMDEKKVGLVGVGREERGLHFADEPIARDDERAVRARERRLLAITPVHPTRGYPAGLSKARGRLRVW